MRGECLGSEGEGEVQLVDATKPVSLLAISVHHATGIIRVMGEITLLKGMRRSHRD